LESPETSKVKKSFVNGQIKVSNTLEAHLNPMYFTPKNESRMNGKRTKSNEKLPLGDTEKFSNEFFM